MIVTAAFTSHDSVDAALMLKHDGVILPDKKWRYIGVINGQECFYVRGVYYMVDLQTRTWKSVI